MNNLNQYKREWAKVPKNIQTISLLFSFGVFVLMVLISFTAKFPVGTVSFFILAIAFLALNLCNTIYRFQARKLYEKYSSFFSMKKISAGNLHIMITQPHKKYSKANSQSIEFEKIKKDTLYKTTYFWGKQSKIFWNILLITFGIFILFSFAFGKLIF